MPNSLPDRAPHVLYIYTAIYYQMRSHFMGHPFLICNVNEWWCGYIHVIQLLCKNMCFKNTSMQSVKLNIFIYLFLVPSHISTRPYTPLPVYILFARCLVWKRNSLEFIKWKFIHGFLEKICFGKYETAMYFHIHFYGRLTRRRIKITCLWQKVFTSAVPMHFWVAVSWHVCSILAVQSLPLMQSSNKNICLLVSSLSLSNGTVYNISYTVEIFIASMVLKYATS